MTSHAGEGSLGAPRNVDHETALNELLLLIWAYGLRLLCGSSGTVAVYAAEAAYLIRGKCQLDLFIFFFFFTFVPILLAYIYTAELTCTCCVYQFSLPRLENSHQNT